MSKLWRCCITHNTQHHTRTYQHQQLAHKHSNAPRNQSHTSGSMEEGGDGVLRGARVQDASLTGCTIQKFHTVGTPQSKTYLPERTEEGRAEQERSVESPQPGVVHVGVSKLGELRSCCPRARALVHLQEAFTDPEVPAVMMLWIFAWLGRSRLGSLTCLLRLWHSTSKLGRGNFENMNILRMSDEILFHSITTKAASTVMKARISKDADFLGGNIENGVPVTRTFGSRAGSWCHGNQKNSQRNDPSKIFCDVVFYLLLKSCVVSGKKRESRVFQKKTNFSKVAVSTSQNLGFFF